MAISTYSELKSAIADFLNRDDLDSVISTFISLAEADINRSVRHWRMEERSSGQQSAGDQYMQIPADWVETIRMNVAGTSTTPSMTSTSAPRTRSSRREQMLVRLTVRTSGSRPSALSGCSSL